MAEQQWRRWRDERWRRDRAELLRSCRRAGKGRNALIGKLVFGAKAVAILSFVLTINFGLISLANRLSEYSVWHYAALYGVGLVGGSPALFFDDKLNVKIRLPWKKRGMRKPYAADGDDGLLD
jgi:hypothetical protein